MQQDNSGKWNFTNDEERRLAIEAESANAGAHWIKHLIWAAVIVALAALSSVATAFQPLARLFK